ncbi:hypothetical protein [Pseudomonas sp. GM33]|uniref:hypothetical protein n=1 Tax=Pseudomonas sp. GM33 TaxID=1144329 RepID=UPI0012F99D76|nr:hypothetical protein [Pseudomonas sp. GM33]
MSIDINAEHQTAFAGKPDRRTARSYRGFLLDGNLVFFSKPYATHRYSPHTVVHETSRSQQ